MWIPARSRAAVAVLVVLTATPLSRDEARAQRPANPAPLVLQGRIIDGRGGSPIERGVVVITGERIECAGAKGACALPDGATVLDAEAGTILPGLIDLHTHVSSPAMLAMFLPAGVTAIRDLHNTFENLARLEAAPAPRPHVFKAGPLIDGRARWPGSIVVESAEAATAAVDSVVRRGTHVVKLYNGLTPDAFRAAAEAAVARGMPITADLLSSTVDALQAMAWGVRGFEHAAGFRLAYLRMGGDTMTAIPDAAILDSLVSAIIAHGAYVVPTLIVQHQFASETEPSLAGVPLADRIDPMTRAFWAGRQATPAEARRRFGEHERFSAALVARLVARGGRVGAGSDLPNPYVTPGGALHQELALLVEAGLSPLQAIRAATAEAAGILGRDDLGVIEAGRRADLVIVAGNPATDIGDTRGIRVVVRDGVAYTLDRLLELAPPVQPREDGGR